MTNPKVALLLVGFGGPASRQEVRLFLQSVAAGRAIPEERLKEVARHYDAVGGVSPYNASALRLKMALEDWFRRRGARPCAPTLPVHLAFRHSKPGFEEACLAIKKNRIEKLIVFVLSTLRCAASFDRYLEALRPLADGMEMVVTEKFHTHPLFIEAQSRLIQEKPDAFYLFTAHSVPCEMSDKSSYAAQFAESARLVAKKMGLKNWGMAYQSRSQTPTPWLEPDVNEAIRKLDGRFKNLVVIPIGFVCENVEILYDLDIEARKTAEQRGLRYWRIPTVVGEPKFVEMIDALVIARSPQATEAISLITRDPMNTSGLLASAKPWLRYGEAGLRRSPKATSSQ